MALKSLKSRKDTATGEGAVGLKQLRGHVDPLGLGRLAVVGQRQLVEVRQHDWEEMRGRKKKNPIIGVRRSELLEGAPSQRDTYSRP